MKQQHQLHKHANQAHMAKAATKKATQPKRRARNRRNPTQPRQAQKKVVMTPESKLAMQAITSPFKAQDNTAKFPDGRGGESFSTTDKLRKSENNSTWLNDIQQANDQWKQYATQLVPRKAGNVVTQPDAPLPVTSVGSLTSAYKSDQPFAGWNILACNCPVFPAGNDNPLSLAGKYQDAMTWKDIEINKVYYFAVPGTQIDCARGNLGGPLNNYDASPPNGGNPASAGTSSPDPVTAAQQSMWQGEHDLELQQAYGMQLSAPMQIYRVIDFTFSLNLTPPSQHQDGPSLDVLRHTLEQMYPNLPDAAIMAKLFAMQTSDASDPHRYRAQTIHPLAGVTQWKDFSTQMGRTLYRDANFPLLDLPPPPVQSQELVDYREYDVRSIDSRSSQSHDMHDRRDPRRSPIMAGPSQSLASSQAVDSGPFEVLGVSSDFTYHEGHNGVQSLGNKLMVNLATFKIDSNSKVAEDYGESCTSSCIEFTGGLVEARRTVAFGMKLFSTEAALTANGRVCGGELPLGLVTDLLNFQDQRYAHPVDPVAPGPIQNMDWSPIADRMDEWSERIESRMEEFTAYTAIDGCTVRYNTLQTEEQTEYIYTNNDSRLTFTPVQVGFTTDPLGPVNVEVGGPKTAMSRIRAEIPMPYHPACDGSEMVPIILFAPADPVRINYTDIEDDSSREDGLYFQAVLHSECLSSNQFPMEVEESVYDPNWELYSRICAETQNFPIVVKGHSFASFMRKAGRVARTAMKFGARAIEVGEVLLPILGA